MKAYVLTSHLKSLKELPPTLQETDTPKPAANQVLVDVHVAAMNFFDILQIQGKYQTQPPFPYTPGQEFSGVIAASSPVPKGCNFVPGKTRVFGAAQGAYGEQVAADWRQLIEIPEGLSMEQAAGIFVTYPTSYAGLVMRANLRKGEWCLVHAGAGGVGIAAAQIAKALGAKVIATASTQEKLDIAKKYGGADVCINYAEGEQGAWQKEVMKVTGGKGVDVVYDSVGLIIPSLKCIAHDGRIVVVGFAGGNIEKVPMNLVLLKNIAITGIFYGGWTKKEPEIVPAVWAGLLHMIAQGRLRPVVFHQVFQGLESLPAALGALATRKTWGKAVLRVQGSSKSEREAKL